uniref:ISXO2-like transposase domain-containing protein n=2 Tax=Meloidogyne TaxID=189290 RepID=A0A914MB07_MELIC
MEEQQQTYNLVKLGEYVVKNHESALNWCRSNGLLPTTRYCGQCRQPMKFTNEGLGVFRCWRSGCSSNRYAASQNTWFENVNSIEMVAKGILLTYGWTQNFTYDQAVRESTLINTGQITDRHTVSDWYSYCREVCTIYLDGLYDDLGPIGGAGHVIEVDEMKLGRRKYNRGRVVDGSWILGFIDTDTNEVRLEICPENRRDRETLFALIEKHVAPDSCIFTDCWKGYTGLDERGFQHWTVNHQRQFVTEEGVNTNKIESQWRPLRQRLARGGIKSD